MTIQVLNTTEEALNKFRNQPDKRDCYTEKEFFFRYMSYPDGFRYSMQNCLYESVLEVIIDDCKCTPSFANFRLNLDLEVCRGRKLYCARKWMNNFGNPTPEGNFICEVSNYRVFCEQRSIKIEPIRTKQSFLKIILKMLLIKAAVLFWRIFQIPHMLLSKDLISW